MFVVVCSPLCAIETSSVIIDTDMGLDDWPAIIFLLKQKEVMVMAITISGTGLAHCKPAIENALNLIALVTDQKIPVSCGRETPLKLKHAFPESWRVDVDKLFGLTLPKSKHSPSKISASKLILKILKESPQKIKILALGPLTNLAEALKQNSKLMKNKVSEFYIIGGTVMFLEILGPDPRLPIMAF
jgi:pyrimidine-specific ribonucleoside hydrolase